MASQEKKPQGEEDKITEQKSENIVWDRNNFATLDLLLNPAEFDSYEHHALAEEIERNGAYRFLGGGKIKHFSGRSIDAETALIGISQHYHHCESRDSIDYESWSIEDEHSAVFGWPKNDLPKWTCDPKEYHWIRPFCRLTERGTFGNEEICSIARLLLTRKATPAGILCAIEDLGVIKIDDTHRMSYVSSDIFDLYSTGLAEGVEAYAKTYNSGYTYKADCDLLTEWKFLVHGWPYDNLPNFEELIKEHRRKILLSVSKAKPSAEKMPLKEISTATPQPTQQPTPQPTQQPTQQPITNSEEREVFGKSRTSYEHIICALLSYISGERTTNKHPDYKNQTTLIKYLVSKHEGVTGITVSNLKSVFAEANKRRDNLNLQELRESEED